MTSVALLLNPWPDSETRNWPGPVSVDFDPRPVDFDFLRWPLTKSQNFRQGLSCSVFRVDSNFELHFFIWSSKIGQLAHSSLWFLQGILRDIFKRSSRAYPTSSLHRASTLSLREDVKDILNILAQCNRPKFTPTCTNSLEFSRLYILILRFIVTQVIILHSYIIKCNP